MNLYDFNIRLRKGRCRLFGKAAQHRNAQAHISGIEHGDFFSGGINQLLFRLCVTGCADHHGAALGLSIAQNRFHRAVVREIDDHIPMEISQLLKGFASAVFAVNADSAHQVFSQCSTNQLTHCAVGSAYNGSHTCTPSRRISARSFARFSGSMGVIGRRIYSLPKPIALTAALAGMGLTSQNSRLMRFRYLH